MIQKKEESSFLSPSKIDEVAMKLRGIIVFTFGALSLVGCARAPIGQGNMVTPQVNRDRLCVTRHGINLWHDFYQFQRQSKGEYRDVSVPLVNSLFGSETHAVILEAKRISNNSRTLESLFIKGAGCLAVAEFTLPLSELDQKFISLVVNESLPVDDIDRFRQVMSEYKTVPAGARNAKMKNLIDIYDSVIRKAQAAETSVGAVGLVDVCEIVIGKEVSREMEYFGFFMEEQRFSHAVAKMKDYYLHKGTMEKEPETPYFEPTKGFDQKFKNTKAGEFFYSSELDSHVFKIDPSGQKTVIVSADGNVRVVDRSK